MSEEWGIKDPTMSYSAATGDIDNDGDPDLLVAHLDRAVSFYENTSGPERKRISVSLKGFTQQLTCGGRFSKSDKRRQNTVQDDQPDDRLHILQRASSAFRIRRA